MLKLSSMVVQEIMKSTTCGSANGETFPKVIFPFQCDVTTDILYGLVTIESVKTTSTSFTNKHHR